MAPAGRRPPLAASPSSIAVGVRVIPIAARRRVEKNPLIHANRDSTPPCRQRRTPWPGWSSWRGVRGGTPVAGGGRRDGGEDEIDEGRRRTARRRDPGPCPRARAVSAGRGPPAPRRVHDPRRWRPRLATERRNLRAHDYVLPAERVRHPVGPEWLGRVLHRRRPGRGSRVPRRIVHERRPLQSQPPGGRDERAHPRRSDRLRGDSRFAQPPRRQHVHDRTVP